MISFCIGPLITQLSTSDEPLSSNYPSIFIAVREQLGLRLIKRTVPTDVLVIDSVQRPSPNDELRRLLIPHPCP
jgi:hypothetical protein